MDRFLDLEATFYKGWMNRYNSIFSILSPFNEDATVGQIHIFHSGQPEFGYSHAAGIQNSEKNRHDEMSVWAFVLAGFAGVYS